MPLARPILAPLLLLAASMPLAAQEATLPLLRRLLERVLEEGQDEGGLFTEVRALLEALQRSTAQPSRPAPS